MIEGLPQSDGFDTIFVMADRLSKYDHFIALKHPFSAETMAKHFIQEVVRLHGIPCTIVSNRDRIFVSYFLFELHSQMGTTLLCSTVYHPQFDGQTEVVNRCIKTIRAALSMTSCSSGIGGWRGQNIGTIRHFT